MRVLMVTGVPTTQKDDVGIGNPVGRGDDYLIARIEGRQQRVVDDRLAARRHEGLGGLVIEIVLALEFGGDRGAQFGDALDGGVFGFAAPDGDDGASLMWSGVSEIGFARASPMTSRPAAFSSRAMPVIAMVGEGWMRFSDWDRKSFGNDMAKAFEKCGPHLSTGVNPGNSAVRHGGYALFWQDMIPVDAH